MEFQSILLRRDRRPVASRSIPGPPSPISVAGVLFISGAARAAEPGNGAERQPLRHGGHADRGRYHAAYPCAGHRRRSPRYDRGWVEIPRRDWHRCGYRYRDGAADRDDRDAAARCRLPQPRRPCRGRGGGGRLSQSRPRSAFADAAGQIFTSSAASKWASASRSARSPSRDRSSPSSSSTAICRARRSCCRGGISSIWARSPRLSR